MVYCKFSDQSKFKAMDWSAGTQVGNLIYASLIPENELDKAKRIVADTAELNKSTAFQIRKAGSNKVIETYNG